MKRIDKRRVIGTVVILAVVVQSAFAAVTWFARSDAERQLANERGRRDGLEVRIDMAKDTVGAAPPPTPTRWRVDQAPDVSGTLQVIQGLADEAGVELTSLKASKSKTDGKQTFEITGAASPQQVCTFVAKIEGHDRLIVVETGQILPATETAIFFELGLATYHSARKENGR